MTEVATTAISSPGQCGRTRFRPWIRTMVPSAIATAAGVTDPRAAQSASIFGQSAAGSPPGRLIPKRSLIWLAKMMTAMAAVNPTVTG